MAKRWLPWWLRKVEKKRELVVAIRQRDGDNCWCCRNPMVFDGAHPNAGRAATLEHVVPLSKGGGWALDNLVLCHVGCNRHLGANDPGQKERMRQPAGRTSPA